MTAPKEKPPENELERLPIRQRSWRVVGGIAVACAGLMAWYGAREFLIGKSVLALLAYWSVFTGLLCVAFYCVLLDVRYIRAMYIIEQRDAFMQTLGSKEFRAALKENSGQENNEEEE